MIRKFATAATAAVVLSACGATAAAAFPRHQDPPGRCVNLAVGFPTATGHEADAPVTICGLPVHQPRGYQCEVTSGRFGMPGERWSCTVNPRP